MVTCFFIIIFCDITSCLYGFYVVMAQTIIHGEVDIGQKEVKRKVVSVCQLVRNYVSTIPFSFSLKIVKLQGFVHKKICATRNHSNNYNQDHS